MFENCRYRIVEIERDVFVVQRGRLLFGVNWFRATIWSDLYEVEYGYEWSRKTKMQFDSVDEAQEYLDRKRESLQLEKENREARRTMLKDYPKVVRDPA
jgi:hypothetical protein